MQRFRPLSDVGGIYNITGAGNVGFFPSESLPKRKLALLVEESGGAGDNEVLAWQERNQHVFLFNVLEPFSGRFV